MLTYSRFIRREVDVEVPLGLQLDLYRKRKVLVGAKTPGGVAGGWWGNNPCPQRQSFSRWRQDRGRAFYSLVHTHNAKSEEVTGHFWIDMNFSIMN